LDWKILEVWVIASHRWVICHGDIRSTGHRFILIQYDSWMGFSEDYGNLWKSMEIYGNLVDG
jgi:hypothetical protein